MASLSASASGVGVGVGVGVAPDGASATAWGLGVGLGVGLVSAIAIGDVVSEGDGDAVGSACRRRLRRRRGGRARCRRARGRTRIRMGSSRHLRTRSRGSRRWEEGVDGFRGDTHVVHRVGSRSRDPPDSTAARRFVAAISVAFERRLERRAHDRADLAPMPRPEPPGLRSVVSSCRWPRVPPRSPAFPLRRRARLRGRAARRGRPGSRSVASNRRQRSAPIRRRSAHEHEPRARAEGAGDGCASAQGSARGAGEASPIPYEVGEPSAAGTSAWLSERLPTGDVLPSSVRSASLRDAMTSATVTAA